MDIPVGAMNGNNSELFLHKVSDDIFLIFSLLQLSSMNKLDGKDVYLN